VNTFSYTPDFGGQEQVAPRVSVVKFSDGYESRQAVGLNSRPSTWNLTFENRDGTEAAAILSFLQTAGGVSAFLWTPPGAGSALVFVCRTWTRTFVKGGYYTISCAFEQVYEP
jgi:phage-related protein